MPGWGKGIVRESGMDAYTLLYLKWITSRDLLYSNRELCSMLWSSLDRRGVWGRKDTFTCMAEFLCSPPETITTLLIGYTPTQKKNKFRKKKATPLTYKYRRKSEGLLKRYSIAYNNL